MRTRLELATILTNALEYEDIDAVWYVIGELEKGGVDEQSSHVLLD